MAFKNGKFFESGVAACRDVSVALYYALSKICVLFFLSSLGWDRYQWTGIGDEGATALADPRVLKNFKTLK